MEMFVSRMMAVVSLLVGGMTFWLATVGVPGGWVFWRLVGAGLIAYGGYALLFPTSRLVRHLSHGRSGASSRPASVEVVYTRIYAVMAVVVGGVVLWVMSL